MSKASRRSLKDQTPEGSHMESASKEVTRVEMSPDETARYTAEFTAELSFLARQAKLDLLAYLLDMARLEAIRTIQTNGRDT
jgi:hypothetical protein